MVSRRAPVAIVSSPSDFGFYIPDVWDEKAFLPTYRRLSRARAKHPGLAAVRSDVRQHDRDPRPPCAAGQGRQARSACRCAYPDTDLGKALGNLGRLLGAGFGTRIATSRRGGFDTHDAQAEAHADLLQDLGDSLRAWQADLDARGLSDRVLTLIWSEFGRRPRTTTRAAPTTARAACSCSSATARTAASAASSQVWRSSTTTRTS